jgi:hypothetical protein
MVAMNSIPQHELAKVTAKELHELNSYNVIQLCGENPSPTPSGGSTILYLNYSFCIFELEN